MSLRRHLLGLCLLLVPMLLRWWQQRGMPRRLQYESGLAMAALLLLLAGYGLRKGMRWLPLPVTSVWLTLHLQLGLLSLVVYGMHAGLRWPAGRVEQLVALCYGLVAGSGLVGLFLQRSLPRRLAARGGEVIYERIPAVARELREQLGQLADGGSGHGELERLYEERLAPLFAGPRFSLASVVGIEWRAERLARRVAALEPEPTPEFRRTLDRIGELVERKRVLDFQFSLQGALRGWQYLHLPACWALLIGSALHGLLALSFAGDLH